MKLSEKLSARVAKVFARNNDREMVYVTDDGQIFVNDNDANGQAENLKRSGKKHGVTTVWRSDVLPSAAQTDGDDKGDGKQEPAENKGAAKPAPAKPELTPEEQKADATAKLDALRQQLAELPENAHASTRKSLEKKVAAAEAILAGLE